MIILYAIMILWHLKTHMETIQASWNKSNRLYAIHKTRQTPQTVDTPTIQRLHSRIQESIPRHVGVDFEGKTMQAICTDALRGGKHLRAMITLDMAPDGEEAALAVEYIHAASLILDDVMDKDTERRGQPAVYVTYGENATQLAALQLMACAYIKSHRSVLDVLTPKVGSETANRTGMIMSSMISDNLKQLSMGQYMDLYPEDHKIADIIHKKTATLFEISFLNGWFISGRDPSDANIAALKHLAHSFGTLFQIADDFEDYVQDLLQNSKAKKNEQPNYVIQFGHEAAVQTAAALAADISKIMQQLQFSSAVVEESVEQLMSKITAYAVAPILDF